jgi:hypothetical protein
MVQPLSESNLEQVVTTLIELTRLSICIVLLSPAVITWKCILPCGGRGFNHVATTSTYRIPRGQHAVGLIMGQSSLRANEASLTEISPCA